MTGGLITAADGGHVPSVPGVHLTIIIGDGRTRAASVRRDVPGPGVATAEHPKFVGMTVAEALRGRGAPAHAPTVSPASIHLDDRGGVISLLDIADAFEALNDPGLDLDGMSAPVGGRPASEGLRHQLISAISQGRVY